jgi:hypothetical protein
LNPTHDGEGGLFWDQNRGFCAYWDGDLELSVNVPRSRRTYSSKCWDAGYLTDDDCELLAALDAKRKFGPISSSLLFRVDDSVGDIENFLKPMVSEFTVCSQVEFKLHRI